MLVVPGFGQHTKMANQITIAGNIAGIAEGIMYANSKGLNLDLMYQVVTNGSAFHHGKPFIMV